ncbi:hypothetical protein TGRH88_079670 [Toxoplasma gondii]|uniref:Uncharacterized protein n=1 Tax=Toxoplasma gondii TaxID=5811 RepID=A0A7J6K5E2_TOXGO|nr:hypothetical protein TGRH88_079670 [Toxoplasma gondii]
MEKHVTKPLSRQYIVEGPVVNLSVQPAGTLARNQQSKLTSGRPRRPQLRQQSKVNIKFTRGSNPGRGAGRHRRDLVFFAAQFQVPSI